MIRENGVRRSVLGAYGVLAVVTSLVVLSRSNHLHNLLMSPSPQADNEIITAYSVTLESLHIQLLFGVAAAPLVALSAAAISRNESLIQRWQLMACALTAAGATIVFVCTSRLVSVAWLGYVSNTSIPVQPATGKTWAAGAGVILVLVGVIAATFGACVVPAKGPGRRSRFVVGACSFVVSAEILMSDNLRASQLLGGWQWADRQRIGLLVIAVVGGLVVVRQAVDGTGVLKRPSAPVIAAIAAVDVVGCS